MFIYSKKHNWQNDPAVQQILVFPSKCAEARFDKLFAEQVEKFGIADAPDSDLGAMLKLRSVLDGTGQYIPIIRCGVSGIAVWEGRPCASHTEALKRCFYYLNSQKNYATSIFKIV